MVKREEKFNSLFIRGLPDGCDDAKLREMFRKFTTGDEKITSAKVQKDKDGELLDYGYVTF